MARVVLRLRPTGTFAEMDPGTVATHLGRLRRWQTEVVDSRISDAPYLTVLASIEDIDDDAAAELRDVLGGVPAMRTYLLRTVSDEWPLRDAGADALRAAATAVPEQDG
jgi:hypothetical protein